MASALNRIASRRGNIKTNVVYLMGSTFRFRTKYSQSEAKGTYNLQEKNGFVTATKIGTANKIFVAAIKNIAAATKRFTVIF